jgi:hypothetical protein
MLLKNSSIVLFSESSVSEPKSMIERPDFIGLPRLVGLEGAMLLLNMLWLLGAKHRHVLLVGCSCELTVRRSIGASSGQPEVPI